MKLLNQFLDKVKQYRLSKTKNKPTINNIDWVDLTDIKPPFYAEEIPYIKDQVLICIAALDNFTKGKTYTIDRIGLSFWFGNINSVTEKTVELIDDIGKEHSFNAEQAGMYFMCRSEYRKQTIKELL